MGKLLLRTGAYAASFGLLAWVVAMSEPQASFEMAARIGLGGMALVLGLYLLAFLVDTLTWQLAIPSAPLDTRWLYRTFKVRMVGEAFNSALPAGGMGGEPVKAALLKAHYGIGYREGAASLVVAKTVNLIALLLFLCVGFVLMLESEAMAGPFQGVASAGLAAFTLALLAFYVVQRLRLTSRAGRWLGRGPLGRRAARALHAVEEMDGRLVEFYARRRWRFAAAVALALANWWLGVAEIYVVTRFLDRPVSHAEAWMVEAAAQMVRAGAFFLPAGIGAQEGTFFAVFAALTGAPPLGMAVAMVRRIRELCWIAWGFALGALYGRRRV